MTSGRAPRHQLRAAAAELADLCADARRPGAAAALCIAVIDGGAAAGAAKGKARLLAGPRYEVSKLDLHQASWTPVSNSQCDLWQARFVREERLFTLFGLGLAPGSLGLFPLHPTATRAKQD